MGSTSTTTTKDRETPREMMPKRLAPDLSTGNPLVAERGACYWVGVRTFVEGNPERPHPPMANIDVGGVTFPSRFTPWQEGAEGEEGSRGKYPGHIVYLRAGQIAQLKEALCRAVVRWRQREGRHAHGYVVFLETEETIAAAKKRWSLNEALVARLRTRASAFAFMPGDQELSRFIYCQKVADPSIQPGTTFRPSMDIPNSVFETGIEDP